MSAKPFWASKTFWANVVGGVALLAGAAGLPACSPDLDPGAACLPLDEEQQATLIGGIMVVVNLVLRFVTKGPVTIRKEKS